MGAPTFAGSSWTSAAVTASSKRSRPGVGGTWNLGERSKA